MDHVTAAGRGFYIPRPRHIYRKMPVRMSNRRQLKLGQAFDKLFEDSISLGHVISRLTGETGQVWTRYQEVVNKVLKLNEELFGFADSKCGPNWTPLPM